MLKKTSASVGLVIAAAAGTLLTSSPALAQGNLANGWRHRHRLAHVHRHGHANLNRPRILIRIYIYNKNNNIAVANAGHGRHHRPTLFSPDDPRLRFRLGDRGLPSTNRDQGASRDGRSVARNDQGVNRDQGATTARPGADSAGLSTLPSRQTTASGEQAAPNSGAAAWKALAPSSS